MYNKEKVSAHASGHLVVKVDGEASYWLDDYIEKSLADPCSAASAKKPAFSPFRKFEGFLITHFLKGRYFPAFVHDHFSRAAQMCNPMADLFNPNPTEESAENLRSVARLFAIVRLRGTKVQSEKLVSSFRENGTDIVVRSERGAQNPIMLLARTNEKRVDKNDPLLITLVTPDGLKNSPGNWVVSAADPKLIRKVRDALVEMVALNPTQARQAELALFSKSLKLKQAVARKRAYFIRRQAKEQGVQPVVKFPRRPPVKVPDPRFLQKAA